MPKQNARSRSRSSVNVPQPVVLDSEAIAQAEGGVLKSRHEISMTMSVIRNLGG